MTAACGETRVSEPPRRGQTRVLRNGLLGVKCSDKGESGYFLPRTAQYAAQVCLSETPRSNRRAILRGNSAGDRVNQLIPSSEIALCIPRAVSIKCPRVAIIGHRCQCPLPIFLRSVSSPSVSSRLDPSDRANSGRAGSRSGCRISRFVCCACCSSIRAKWSTRRVAAPDWLADTFVDFDHGLNNAIKRLRERSADTAETPRYIETLPRRGYRLMAPLRALEPSEKRRGSSERPIKARLTSRADEAPAPDAVTSSRPRVSPKSRPLRSASQSSSPAS